MTTTQQEPIAVVGVSAIMPDAPDAATFWANIKAGRYSISDVPPERWDPELYYDPDPHAPDKTYSRIGGWVRDFTWEPLAWRLPIPPAVSAQMDDGQKWVVAAARSALLEAGWPDWTVDPERVAVIIGSAIGGDKQHRTNLRIQFPAMIQKLCTAPSFAALPEPVRDAVLAETRASFLGGISEITEDTMPGELANVAAGRVANLFNFRGPNFTTDAACASGLAAMSAAVRGLQAGDFDAAVTGGLDRNMDPAGFVKFCKIGALSATGTRPFDAGADGFVMGEGAALFVLKRLSDAERDGDRIYAVLLGIAGSSDGRGKGITAPNPVGQRLAVERAWAVSGLDPAAATCVEAHGTSTRVGDATELASLADVFGKAGAQPGSIALGSVKSNIGHLKGAAGAAGLFKTVLSLHDKVLVPSLHFEQPNPNVDWNDIPFRVNTELSEWPAPDNGVRCAGVSSFGFGGTNFHAVLEEYVPGRHRPPGEARSYPGATIEQRSAPATDAPVAAKAPLRGAAVVGGADDSDVAAQLDRLAARASAGQAPAVAPPDPTLASAPVRVAIDYADAADLATKATKAAGALRHGDPAVWRMLRVQGVFVGRGAPGKVAFLYTGQGSQYVNMLSDLRAREPIVQAMFDEADRVTRHLLDKPLTDYIFTDSTDEAVAQRLSQQLMQTEITQPAVLATDLALARLLDAYGVRPDMVIGHSLGEYGALMAADALSLDAALEAASVRGRAMADLPGPDNGAMAAVTGPLSEIERIVGATDGYVVVANINSTNQAVIGGATDAVERAVAALQAAGMSASRLPVSHAFHTAIVAPVSEPLKTALRRLGMSAPRLPVVSNVTGDFYPADADLDTVLDLLSRQVASPVRFVDGLRTLYDAGARVFVEVGPKKALHGFVEDVLGDDVLALFTNHPKTGDVASFNRALCGLYAAGLGFGSPAAAGTATAAVASAPQAAMPDGRSAMISEAPVVITGAALGLPGVERVFDDENVARILDGQQFIDTIPHRLRRSMLDRHITRLVKRESGDPTFETIDNEADVIKLAGRSAPLDVVAEFAVDTARDAALDSTTKLAIGAGFDALRDAGIPLVMHYKTTTLGTQLPDRWGLPDSMRDDTGVIFASAFPGYDNFARDLEHYYVDRSNREHLLALEAVRARMSGDEPAVTEVDRRIHELRHACESNPYRFDRRFIFRCLAMGHSQFAEIIGARGPNTQVNAACASTTQATSLAEDWIRVGRCRRVIVVSADDASSDALLPWLGSGFLASGAAATDDIVEEAATPFDRRRHGMILGMGAAAFVVESAESAAERGLQPICEVLGTVTANSAFHGTRLDVEHIGGVMEHLVAQAEARGVDRHAIAPNTVFVSHETYTPARGGSAAAEINALRRVFGSDADAVVITNTKGFTGHAMGAGIEDIVAIKSLETGLVPPVPNFKEPDPELGRLNLSVGGSYPVQYALRLGAGFGSQIAMTLLRWTPVPDGRHRPPDELGYEYRIIDRTAWRRWLAQVSGRPDADLEIVQHRLRIVDTGAPVPAPRAPVAAAVPAPAQEPAVLSAPEPAAVAAADEVIDVVVGTVAELTGYPRELLDLDLDLEADLGVDTVKQAEIFAAIREHYGVARDENLKLRDFPTLNHVIAWIRDKAGVAGPAAEVPAPAPVPAAAAPAVPAGDEVIDVVVGTVAELTGYPRELLDLDLDLEADLGVDTVKQAEIFAAIREHYGVARDENLKLRDFPTLNHVIAWIRDKAEAQAHPKAPTEAAQAAQSAVAVPPTIEGDIAATDRITRRVPVPALRPELAACVPTGVTLGKGTRVAVMGDEGGVADALTARLTRLGVDVVALRPDDDVSAVLSDEVDGVYWLAALDDEGPLERLDLAGWREALRRRVRNLYTTMRHLYERSPFLVVATRLGGYHGYDATGATCPLGGAVTGFAKAYRRERPEALVKAVDFPVNRKTAALADALIDETLRDPGCVEVGHADGRRWGVGLAERPFSAEASEPLGPDPVFLVTGAAGSIVSAITADLAAAWRGTFHLLDLTPEPDPADPDLRRYTEDRDGLKVELADRMRARGERPTPVLIERELARLERLQAALAAIRAVEAAGGSARYHSVDLTDAAAVDEVMAQVREASGRVDVLLHAAGVEVSHGLPDKEPAEFDLVLGVKGDGLFNVLHADLPLGAVVAFSSVAGRFGNMGQTDYSAANDLQCKILSNLRRTRPEVRTLAIDWTAWGGIGMATRGPIPKIMAAAGVEMLPPEAGVAWIRRELGAGLTDGEVVVAGALGGLTAEPHDTGGVNPASLTPDGPMIGEVVRASVHDGLVLHTTLDPATRPFLDHHRIEGTPVLPGVMGMETFAEAARLLAPDLHVAAIENVDFRAPLKFYRDEPRTLTVTALVRPDGDDLVAECRLSAERTLPGSDQPQRTVHFTGSVRLTAEPATLADGGAAGGGEVPALSPEQVYRLYFHGPAYRVVGSAWRCDDGAAARFVAELPPQTGEPVLIGPRLVELCFQTVGLFEAGTEGVLALPLHVDALHLNGTPTEGAGLVATARPDGRGGFVCTVRDDEGRPVLRLDGYRTVPLPQPPPADVVAPIRAVMRG
ncbi:beta-ketoacyl synthase [Mycobacterium sp. 852002-53434_SCH5985345]|uniref:type I polyketide synthase n=1 Tax=Mycobacterium sp. 852002-53434_SCH5985345 TaxID=1834107 RepID=UPI0007FD1BCB|nr:type I polyketide synthase [Mycobacterium sp. 852002-53434_SCH5985345]OBF53141.1 beta-ketoacyl synthase [Mycobacterium sp. 852002-53434_SCH5985345]